MAVSLSDIKVGDEIVVKQFTAEVVEVESDDLFCTKVRDQQGNVHLVYRTQLVKPVPYEDGQRYKSASGFYYRYAAAADGTSPGSWQELSGAASDTVLEIGDFNFKYPTRPLRKVEFGPELTD